MENTFGVWFLLLSLFLPRFTIFFWWISHSLPPHITPFLASMFGSILIPRILILVWIYQAMGFCGWFWIDLVVMLVVWVFQMINFSAQINKRS
jgi:hypothetical protein